MCSCPPRPDRRSGWPWATACRLGRRCWRSTPSEAIPPPQHAARRDRRAEPVHAVQPVLRHLVHGAGVARGVLSRRLVHLLRGRPRRARRPGGAPLAHRHAVRRGARQPGGCRELRRRAGLSHLPARVRDRQPGGVDLLLLLRHGGRHSARPVQHHPGWSREALLHGLPSPAAGMTLATFFPFTTTDLYQQVFRFLPRHHLMQLLMILLTILMVSNVRYATFPRAGLRTLKGFLGLATILFILVFGILEHDAFFFPLGITYMVYGILRATLLGFFFE